MVGYNKRDKELTMFSQNNVYIATEYGTRPCAEYREPCGAFYSECAISPSVVHGSMTGYMPDTHYARAGRRINLSVDIKTLMEEFDRDLRAACPPKKVREEYHQLAFNYVTHGDMNALSRMHEIYRYYRNLIELPNFMRL